MTEPNDTLGHSLSRTIYSHSELYFASLSALKRGKKTNDRYDFMTASVMAAFAFEAYLNFVGQNLLSNWTNIAKKSINKKLKDILIRLEYKPFKNESPYNTIENLRLLRNSIAHATTETVTEVRNGPPAESLEYPEVFWEKACKREIAEKLVNDVGAVIKDLHTRSKIGKGALGMLSEQGGEILRKDKS